MKKDITFKKVDITEKEAKDILDAYFDSKDENYKKGLMEITPFKGGPFKNYFYKCLAYFQIQKELKKNKEAFVYRLALITGIDKSNKKYFYLKLLVNGKAKVFFYINIKSEKRIIIDKMISIQKGLGKQAIKELCDYYNIYNIIVEPSIYGIGFWKKIKLEYKGKINITIKK